jgi:hypothetical protein
MQQASQNPYAGMNQSSRNPLSSLLMSAGGLGSSASTGLSAGLLSQLEQLKGATQPSAQHESSADALSGLAGAQGLLGFAGANQLAGTGTTGLGGGGGLTGNSALAGSALFQRPPGAAAPNLESAGVSDALSLLARSIPRGDGSNHGFGGLPDRQDGGDRYN